MQQLRPKQSQQSEETMTHKERVALRKKKISILKDAVHIERQGNSKLIAEYVGINEQLRRHEQQTKKKEEKNEVLLMEIRSLKEALINQKNQKQYLRQLQEIEMAMGPTKQPGHTPQQQEQSGGFFGGLMGWLK